MTNLVQFPGLGLSFELDRVAFSIGGMNIYWYGVCIAVGMCLALVFAFRHSVEFGVDADAMVDVILIGVVMGILCARLYYVALSPYQYHSLKDVLAIRDGGLAIYGGIIGGFSVRRAGLQVAESSRAAHVRPGGHGLPSSGRAAAAGATSSIRRLLAATPPLPWGMYSEATRDYLMGSVVTAQKALSLTRTCPSTPRSSMRASGALWALLCCTSTSKSGSSMVISPCGTSSGTARAASGSKPSAPTA